MQFSFPPGGFVSDMSTHEHEEEEVGRIVENMVFAIDAADDSKTLSPSLPAEYVMEIGGDDNAVELDLVDASTTPGMKKLMGLRWRTLMPHCSPAVQPRALHYGHGLY